MDSQDRKDRIAELRATIAEASVELRELEDGPLSVEEAAELARTDPAAFNRRFDAALRSGGRAYLITKETTR
jgi:hypothetical protein